MVCLARLRPFNVIQSQRLPPKRSKTKWYHYIQDLSVMYFNTVLCKFRPNIPHSWWLDCSSFGSSLFWTNCICIWSAESARACSQWSSSVLAVEFFLTNQRFSCPAAPAQTVYEFRREGRPGKQGRPFWKWWGYCFVIVTWKDSSKKNRGLDVVSVNICWESQSGQPVDTLSAVRAWTPRLTFQASK